MAEQLIKRAKGSEFALLSLEHRQAQIATSNDLWASSCSYSLLFSRNDQKSI